MFYTDSEIEHRCTLALRRWGGDRRGLSVTPAVWVRPYSTETAETAESTRNHDVLAVPRCRFLLGHKWGTLIYAAYGETTYGKKAGGSVELVHPQDDPKSPSRDNGGQGVPAPILRDQTPSCSSASRCLDR